MPDTTVQLPDGRTLVIPDGTSLDKMAQLRNKLAVRYANPVTGQGMMESAGAKEQQQIGQPLVQAADEHIANQMKLGERMNRASRSPTPFTNAISAVDPVGTAKMLAGSKIGSYLGEKINPEYGGAVGGLLGGLSPALVETKPPEVSARRSYLETVQPKGTGSVNQLETMQEFDRAAPYLKQAQAESPVLAKQPSGPLKGQRLGVLNYRQNALTAADKLWNDEITPRTNSYAKVPIDHSSVATDIRGTINPNSPVDAAKSSAVNDLADFYDTPTTVGDAMEKIKALNEDKQIQAYQKVTPDKQAEMVGANPQLEAKLKAADSLRERTFDAIEQNGNPEDANYIREARKDFGALKGVAQKLGETKVPTPETLSGRVMNTVHGVISPYGAHAYIGSGGLDTLFRISDPNRLAAASSFDLGRSALSPRVAPPIRSTPWEPPQPKGLLPSPPPPPTEAGWGGADTSGPFRDPTARWVTPRALLPYSPEQAAPPQVPKQETVSPPAVSSKPVQNPAIQPPATNEGIGALARDTAKAEQTRPVRETYTPDQIENAKLFIRSILDTMASGDRPGRYFNEWDPENRPIKQNLSIKEGERAGGHWMSVQSVRDKLPWIKDHPEWSPSQLDRALKSGNGSPVYEKVIRSAIKHLEYQTPEGKAAADQAAGDRMNGLLRALGKPTVD